jgi:hypothetical protein
MEGDYTPLVTPVVVDNGDPMATRKVGYLPARVRLAKGLKNNDVWPTRQIGRAILDTVEQ